MGGRARECGSTGTARWWRSLEERAAAHAAEARHHPEFPDLPGSAVDRRTLLKLMGAALAMGATACSEPAEEIVPYVDMPEGLVPGEPLFFATALPLLGPAAPAIVESREGRPIKVEGNPGHPWSRGATDAFAQAAVLSLYDPDRARTPARHGQIASWNGFISELAPLREELRRTGGRGLRLLGGAVTSPTLARLMGRLRARLPEARWHRWQPVNDDHVHAGARLAFGRPLEPLYRFGRARVVLALDADPLGPGPHQVRYARDFADTRRARKGMGALGRLYAVEPALSLTGAQADHRLAVRSGEVLDFAAALAAELEGAPAGPARDAPRRRFLEALARDLAAHRGAAVVAAGERQPAALHALAHWLNHRLGALGETVEIVPPVEADPVDHRASLRALVADMRAGEVSALVILGGNPAYDAPADLGFAAALGQVAFSVRLGLYEDETSAHCLWHLPESHPLEAWSDARAPDGTASVVQPLITPLFESRTAAEAVALLLDDYPAGAHALVRATWREGRGAGFDNWWRTVLHDGVVAESAAAPVAVAGAPRRPEPAAPPAAGDGFELLLPPDPAVWDGRFANNAWLQELPRPLSKLVWGNALYMAPADAARLGLADGDTARVRAAGRSVEAPVMAAPGQAAGTLVLHLGYGRTRAGAVGSGVGVDAYPLTTVESPWRTAGATVEKTGGKARLVSTQGAHSMHRRDIVRSHDLAALARLAPEPGEPATLYPELTYDGYAWAMVIDQSVCTGCNACVLACQAENNVPVVGPEEVARGRDMHWLRVDRYYAGAPEAPEVFFQPVACVHCEKAPCEPVCPVGASVHDGEGLNVQVYNRCIGTRFCQTNCPYMVRRFNFFGYAQDRAYANLGAPLYRAAHNPDVSVRGRGVMEKCTYCVQRISRARRRAKTESRRIAEGEVVTACQAACPAQAIHFGDLNRRDSHLAALRREPHAYALLGHLGTRPRTRHLARVRDPNPKLGGDP